MKKFVALGASVLVLSVLVSCGTARLDKKLDEEYEEVKSEVVPRLSKVDSLYKHAQSLVRAHDNEDTEIDKKPLRPGDKDVQEHHDTWIANLQPTLAEIGDWLDLTVKTFINYDSLEVTHDEASASDIKADHQAMMDSLTAFSTKAEEYGKKLGAVIDTLKSFLREHGELRDKYNITLGSSEQPVYK